MPALRRNLTIADGQVAAGEAAEILAGEDKARRYALIFSNVSETEEALVLTVVRTSVLTGEIARRELRVPLAPNEQLEIDGLPLNADDSLRAATSNAAAVDYLAFVAGDGSRLRQHVYDPAGLPKSFSLARL